MGGNGSGFEVRENETEDKGQEVANINFLFDDTKSKQREPKMI